MNAWTPQGAPVTIPALILAVLLMTPGGGWTHGGTVTGKGYIPAHSAVQCLGNRCQRVQVPECWRLDVTKWGLDGWGCADRASWLRAKPGDRWERGHLIPGKD